MTCDEFRTGYSNVDSMTFDTRQSYMNHYLACAYCQEFIEEKSVQHGVVKHGEQWLEAGSLAVDDYLRKIGRYGEPGLKEKILEKIRLEVEQKKAKS